MDAAVGPPGIERMGRDWCVVYRSFEQHRPCLGCGAPTRLILVFKPGGPALAICGTCRGY